MKREINRELAAVQTLKDDGTMPVDLHQVIKDAQQTAQALGKPNNSIEFYDEESTAKALTLFAQGASYRKIEAETGIARHTLIRLKFDQAANIEKLKPYFARKFAAMVDQGLDLMQEKFDRLYEDPTRLDEISPDRLAVTVGVMTDKAAQLAGMASAVIEHRKGSSIEDAAKIIAEARARIAAKTAVIDAEILA